MPTDYRKLAKGLIQRTGFGPSPSLGQTLIPTDIGWIKGPKGEWIKVINGVPQTPKK